MDQLKQYSQAQLIGNHESKLQFTEAEYLKIFLQYRRNDWSTDALIGKMEVSKEINHVQSFLGVRSALTRF